MSRTSSDRDPTATPRAATLIADPANVGWPLTLIYVVAVLIDQTVGLGARWDEGLVSLRAAEIISGIATTLLLLWLAKLLYLRTRFARRHAWVMVATMFVAVSCCCTVCNCDAEVRKARRDPSTQAAMTRTAVPKIVRSRLSGGRAVASAGARAVTTTRPMIEPTSTATNIVATMTQACRRANRVRR